MVQVIHALVDLPFHQEDHSFSEEFEFMDVRGIDPEIFGSVYVVVCTVEVKILDLALSDLDQRTGHSRVAVVYSDASFER